MITAFKDEGRSDLRPHLARLLVAAAADALRETPQPPASWVVVTVPSSPAATRRRGRHPVGELAAALYRPGLVPGPRLALRRAVREQSALDRAERLHNLAGAYRIAKGATSARGLGVLLVDDVVTTGATLRAATKAVLAAEPAVIRAATVAATGGLVQAEPSADEHRVDPQRTIRAKSVTNFWSNPVAPARFGPGEPVRPSTGQLP